MRTLSLELPTNKDLRRKSATELQALFKQQAQLLKTIAAEGPGDNASSWLRDGLDYINKACYFASRLDLSDQLTLPHLANWNGAWSKLEVSKQLILVSRVLIRIKQMTEPTVAEVEHVLDQMTAVAAAYVAEPL